MPLFRLLTLTPQTVRLSGAISFMPMKSMGFTTATTTVHTPSKRVSPVEASKPLALICKNFSTTARVDGKGGMLASQHWTWERIMSIVTVSIIPVAFVLNHPVTDCLLSLSTVIHAHWGLEAIAIDYLCRPLIMNKPVSPMVGKVGIAIVYLLSIVTLAALINFNINDVGLTKAIKMYWAMN